MQGGIDCNAAGAMSHAMQHALAGAAMGGDMHMHHAMHDAMHDDGDEAWAHDFVMNPHMHHHMHHHHHHHHFMAMQPHAAGGVEDWGGQYQQQYQGHQHDAMAEADLEAAMEAATLEAAYAEGEQMDADAMEAAYAEGMAEGEAAVGMDSWLQQYREAKLDEDDWEGQYGADEVHGNDDWLKEYEEMTKQGGNALQSTDYPFEANNPYLFHDDPFMEAHELLAAGTLSEAVLAFEAACQKDPKAVEHWQCLGSTQAENEKDSLAIIALNNAIKLCPTSLPALSALAVSHTNEANHGLAIRALRNWIAANEHYPGVAQAVGEVVRDVDEDMDVTSPLTNEYLFVDAAEHRQRRLHVRGGAGDEPRGRGAAQGSRRAAQPVEPVRQGRRELPQCAAART
jgi:hypothetical protein